MDDTVVAIVQDISLDNSEMNEKLLDSAHLKGDPNATIDTGSYGNHHYTVIENENDEYDDNEDQIKQEPNVVTWFTFFSHREQREYYYEPISGTTTWIAPSQIEYDRFVVDGDETDDGNNLQSSSSGAAVITNIISRLPGSPMLHESIQNQVNHAITVSTQIHQNHILPVITKRPIAITLLVCNVVLFYIWIRSVHIVDNRHVFLNSTHGMNASTTNSFQMITDNEEIVDESQLIMSLKAVNQPQTDETYQEDINIETITNDSDNPTIFEGTYVFSDVRNEDIKTDSNSNAVNPTQEIEMDNLRDDITPEGGIDVQPTDINVVGEETVDINEGTAPDSNSNAVNLTQEIEMDNLHDDIISEGGIAVQHTDVNVVGEEIVDINKGTASAVLATSESMSDSYAIVNNSTDENAQITPNNYKKESLLLDEITTNTNEFAEVVAAGTSRDSIPAASIVTQPDRKLDIQDAIKPNLMIVTETNDSEVFTISDNRTTITSELDENSNTVDNDGNIVHNSDEDVVDVVDEEITTSISSHDLGRYEAIQKEAMMVVQRVGMNAINAGYMIELEPNLTTDNLTPSIFDADFYTSNTTWI